MSRLLPQKTFLTLLAVVPALVILKVKRAPKKPPLLLDLKDTTSHVDADGVTGQLFDIIIVGGKLPLPLHLAPSADNGPLIGTAGCVLAARLSEESSLRVLVLESGERYAVAPLIGCLKLADDSTILPPAPLTLRVVPFLWRPQSQQPATSCSRQSTTMHSTQFPSQMLQPVLAPR